MSLSIVLLFFLNACICVKACEVGWVQFKTNCYMFSQTTSTWGEAESICNAFHSKLAEPMTNEEAEFLISHSQNQAGEFWLGISDIIEEDRWIYSSNQQPILVNKFHPSQPNGYTGSGCVALWKPYHGLWADEPCSRHYGFICQKPPESPGNIIG